MTSETAQKEAKSDPMAAKKAAILAKTKQIAANFEKLAKPAFEFMCVMLPMLVQFGNFLNKVWNKLDDNVIKSILGFAFCFFGGMYPTVFAAIQAAEQGGRALVISSVKELSVEATRILQESKKEDDKVEPKNLSNQEYIHRKTMFVLQKMNPEKVNTALQNIYKVWFVVISVLVVKFARTIQTANSIAEFLTKPSEHYAKPVVEAMLPAEYQQWIPVLLKWACKTIGVTLAWTLASIRIAFASSMQGGLMLARSGLVVMRQRNISLGGMIKPTTHHSQTNIDEYAAYVFAAVGFLFQMYFRLSPPFPMNFLLFPFHIAEWVLRYGVMKASSAE